MFSRGVWATWRPWVTLSHEVRRGLEVQLTTQALGSLRTELHTIWHYPWLQVSVGVLGCAPGVRGVSCTCRMSAVLLWFTVTRVPGVGPGGAR